MNETAKLVGLDIIEDLPAIWIKYPGGASITQIAQELDLPYHSVHSAILWLSDNGKLQWLQRPDRQAAVVVPNGWEPPAWNLTEKQQRIVTWMTENADDTSTIQTTYKGISAGANVAEGSISAHLDALARKGYVHIVEVGTSSGEKSNFKVWPDGNGPQRHRALAYQNR